LQKVPGEMDRSGKKGKRGWMETEEEEEEGKGPESERGVVEGRRIE
jgi:hypothetical protein